MFTSLKDSFMGAWWGAFLGDAVAMPVHGYNTPKLMAEDYDGIGGLIAPKFPHRESIMHNIPVVQMPKEFDYVAHRGKYWQTIGSHYHQTLAAGENTLPLYIALHLADEICKGDRFSVDAWLKRYEFVMTSPGGHNDIFVPTIHRTYFNNRAAGKETGANGCQEAHMGDIAILVPAMLLAVASEDEAETVILRLLKRFTRSSSNSGTAFFFAQILRHVIHGDSIEDALFAKLSHDSHFAMAYPIRRWVKNNPESDAEAVSQLGRLAPLEEAAPLSVYLAYKYAGSLEKALKANALIGGEATGRGAIVGAIVGAQTGLKNIPEGLREKLVFANQIRATGERLFAKLVSLQKRGG